MTNRIIMRVCFAAVCGSSALVAACGGDAPGPQSEASAIPVTVAPVSPGTETMPIRSAGRLGDRAAVPLSFGIGGVVATVSARSGDRVGRGELLAALDLSEIDARVAIATAAVQKTERDLARAERLHADSVVTRIQLEDARTAADIARADLQAVRFARENAEIRAPASGRVTGRRVEPGQVVAAGQPALELGEAGWRFRTGIPDRDALRMVERGGEGLEGTARFEALPGVAFDARVVEIAGAAEARTGTFEVELAVTDPDERLRSGLIGSVTIFVPRSEGVVRIPAEALVMADGSSGEVFLVETGTDGGSVARRMPVEILHITQEGVFVSDAFPEGARIVIRGAAYVTDGTEVTVIREPQ